MIQVFEQKVGVLWGLEGYTISVQPYFCQETVWYTAATPPTTTSAVYVFTQRKLHILVLNTLKFH